MKKVKATERASAARYGVTWAFIKIRKRKRRAAVAEAAGPFPSLYYRIAPYNVQPLLPLSIISLQFGGGKELRRKDPSIN